MEKLWGKSAPSTWNVAIAAMQYRGTELIEHGKRKTPLLPAWIKRKKVASRLPKPVPEAEVTRVLNTVTDPQDKALLEILAASGLRATELGTLTFGQIDDDGIITVIGKGNKERKTFMTTEALDALNKWVAVGHLLSRIKLGKVQPSRATQYMRDNCPDVGLWRGQYHYVKDLQVPSNWVYYHVKKHTDHPPHEFRHFWVTDLMNNGADIMAVMDAAGHSSIKTTRGYTKVLKRQVTSLRSMHSREQGRV